jgi:hypothetical protein
LGREQLLLGDQHVEDGAGAGQRLLLQPGEGDLRGAHRGRSILKGELHARPATSIEQSPIAYMTTPSVATLPARHDIGLQPNLARNHRENELKAENPSRSETSLSDRPSSST